MIIFVYENAMKSAQIRRKYNGIDQSPIQVGYLKSRGKPVVICAHCHRVRMDYIDVELKNLWVKLDFDPHKDKTIPLSHGICPRCISIHYPEYT